MELLFIKNNVLSLLKEAQNELMNHSYVFIKVFSLSLQTSYETRLAIELDCQLFSLFLHQYDDQYNYIYSEPIYSFELDILF